MSYLERIQSSGISRRGFVKASAAAVAALSVAGIAGCAPNSVEETEETTTTEARDIVSGEWKSAACWHNCGGRCVNKVLVRDGVAIRQKTDDSHEDSPEYFQQRSCVRGHSQRMQCFGADRLKYPMKRKGWSPDNPNGEMRGKDEWERISWDEAFKYVADELKKAYDNYGPRSVLMHGSRAVNRVTNTLGGTVSMTDTNSFGTYCFDVPRLGLATAFDQTNSANDRFDMKNAEWIVFQGCNPAWASGGSPCYHFLQAKKAGVKFAMISPSYNATAQLFDARWIPVRTGTDTAFMLSVAYEMLKLDESEGDIIDWDFLHTYCVGFDAESMPKGAKTDENFSDYVLGKYDDTPKTAEWASEICGTPVEDIRWYAEILGKSHATMMLHSYAFARNHDAEDIPQLYMTLGCMGGHFGKSGHACGSTYHAWAGNGGPNLVVAGSNGLEAIANPVDDAIMAPIIWDSILAGKYKYFGMPNAYVPAEERDLDIHVAYYESSARFQTTLNLLRGIEVLRSLDFVFCNAQFLTTQAKYSDIVLPVTTEWETPGGFTSGNREALFVYTQITPPLYEAKTDREIGYGIAQALGLNADEIYPLSETQMFMNQILGSTVMEPSGEMVPLVTVTQEDLDAWGCTGTPQEGKVDLATFLANGCYQVERTEGDDYTFIAYKDFIDDPEANPVGSESGKFEIYCQWKKDMLDGIGYSTDFKPYPSYRKPVEGYETTFVDGKIGGEKTEYPYLIYNPHYYRRSHTVLDNVQWLQEAWPNPVYLARSDAEEKGIVSGDTVCIYTPAGKGLRTACVLDTLMPGHVGVPHGTWIDMDENEEYDLAGCDNVLTGSSVSGMGVSGYNNFNCNFEKFEGEPLVPDCEKPQRIIEL